MFGDPLECGGVFADIVFDVQDIIQGLANHDSKNLMHTSMDIPEKYSQIGDKCGVMGPWMQMALKPLEETLSHHMAMVIMFGLAYGQLYEGIHFDGMKKGVHY